MSELVLSESQIAALADALVARLQRPSGGLVDAQTLADYLAVDRSYVYQHASELGARRLGGPGGRLRFDLDHALAAHAARDEPAAAAPRRRPRRRATEHVGSILKPRV